MALAEREEGGAQQIIWDWTSDASGDVTITTDSTYHGKVLTLVTIPHATAPAADYDLTAVDRNGVDVLHAGGIDRHTTNTEYVASASLGAVSDSVLILTIDNGGNAKKGKAVITVGL